MSWQMKTFSKNAHENDWFGVFSNREHQTSANVTICCDQADKHHLAPLIKLDKSPINFLWCLDVCSATARLHAARDLHCRSEQGGGKKQRTLSFKHKWEERRKLENAIQVLGDVCKTTDRFLHKGRCVSVTRNHNPSVSICTCDWMCSIRSSTIFCQFYVSST